MSVRVCVCSKKEFHLSLFDSKISRGSLFSINSRRHKFIQTFFFLPHILIKNGFLENVLEHTKFIGS